MAAKKKRPAELICRSCYYDLSLPEEDQFGFPRGKDVRRDGSNGNSPYCGTCGEDHSIVEST